MSSSKEVPNEKAMLMEGDRVWRGHQGYNSDLNLNGNLLWLKTLSVNEELNWGAEAKENLVSGLEMKQSVLNPSIFLSDTFWAYQFCSVSDW